MAKQDLMTSKHYMENVIPESPECIKDGIPMAVMYDHGVKGKDPIFFCGHCGIISPQ